MSDFYRSSQISFKSNNLVSNFFFLPCIISVETCKKTIEELEYKKEKRKKDFFLSREAVFCHSFFLAQAHTKKEGERNKQKTKKRNKTKIVQKIIKTSKQQQQSLFFNILFSMATISSSFRLISVGERSQPTNGRSVVRPTSTTTTGIRSCRRVEATTAL